MLEEPALQPEPPERGKRVAMIVGGLAGTALLLALVMTIGSWGFRYRSASLHQGRLERLLERQPKLAQVVAGLEEEGTRLVASAASEDELRQLAAAHGGLRTAEILDKGRHHGRTRAFQAGEAVYVLYFDNDDVLRDFTCVTR